MAHNYVGWIGAGLAVGWLAGIILMLHYVGVL